MDYGAFFRADDGSLLVTSDSQCYEFVGEVGIGGRTGNVNTYLVTTQAYPLVFAKCGAGQAAGILAVEGSPGSWTVSVLATVSCPIEVFVPITGASNTGQGLVVYNKNNVPVFDSYKNILNARAIGDMSETSPAIPTPSGTDMVSFTAGPVKPVKTITYAWVLAETYDYTYSEYVCVNTLQYVCETVYVNVCVPGPDMCYSIGDYSYCYPGIPVCTLQPSQSCGYTWVQACDWVTHIGGAAIYGYVKTTSWTLDRGTAFISVPSTSVNFQWVRHKEGYYKEVLEWKTEGYSLTIGGNNLPPGYFPSPAVIGSLEPNAGDLTKNSTFPYTSDRVNTAAQTCITAIRSNYD